MSEIEVEDNLWQLLEEHFPVWNQAEMDAMKPEEGAEKFEDEFGTLMPKFLNNYIDCWKRPDTLVTNNPDVPMVTFVEPNDESNRRVKGEVFAGNDKGFEWLVAVIMAIRYQSDTVAPNDYLWECIYPKDKSTGLPTVNPLGKYCVKLYFMKEWRRVDIDDRVPVDLFGRPLPVGIRPIQLWPLLLTKAILKLMAAFGVLEKTSPCDVPAFTWLTSWPTESIVPPSIDNISGSLYDRLCDAKINKDIVVTCSLKERAASDRPPPRMVVLCGPSGVGIGKLMDKVLENFSERFGRCVSHTTRPPMEHEVFGLTYNFVDEEAMKLMDDEHKFLEMNKIVKYSKVFPGTYHYGTSLSTVREIAAAGKLCITTVDLQGCQDLYNREGVDALYVFVEPPTSEFLEKKLTLRLKEAESTVQKRMDYAQSEIESSAELGPFDHEIVTDDYEKFFMEVKEAISVLSPIIRNRIRGLPPYLLDYSDLIPSNSVEKPDVKPVIIAGPDDTVNERIISALIEEFPDVFGFALRYTTNEQLASKEKDKDTIEQKYKYIPEEEFSEMKGKGGFMEESSDLFVHETLVKQYGTTSEEIQKCIDQSKLCIIKSSVTGTKMMKDKGMDALSIFLKPPDMEVHRSRLRSYLAEPQSAIQSMLEDASAMRKKAGEMDIFDSFIVNADVDKAFLSLKDCISKYRPDIVQPMEPKEEGSEEIIQSPIILCGPPGVGKTLLIEKLVKRYPEKFESCISYTTRSALAGEEDGVHFHFVDKKKMESLIESGACLEHSQILGNTYATPLEEVNAISANGKICVMNVDIEGAEQIKKSGNWNEMIYIFVGPPAMETFESQLKEKKIDKDDVIQKKIDFATAEMQKLTEKSEAGDMVFNTTIVNKNDENTFLELLYYLAKLPRQLIEPIAKPVFICGPVGCGKHELITHLFRTFPGKFAAPKIHTSRQPSEKEKDESDYIFVSRGFFEDGVESGKMLYQEEVLDHLYGISVDSVEVICKLGMVPVIDVDTVEQAEQMKKIDSESLFIFVGPSDISDIRAKLLVELEKSQPPGYSTEEALDMRLDFIKAQLDAFKSVTEEVFDCNIEVTAKEMLQLEVEAYEQVGNVSYHKLLESMSLYVPEQVSIPEVWGYGQQLWDHSVRQYGQMQLKVVILGPAGSGKTTQCKLLSEKFQIPIISPGLLLYEEVQNKTELGLQAKVYMDSTRTVPEDLIVTVIKNRIAMPDCQLQGWLLDGFPHTTKEANALSRARIIPDKVIFLESRQDVLLWRCQGRRIDPSNPHDVYFVPPSSDHTPPEVLRSANTTILPLNDAGEEDPVVSSRLTIRHDDTEENFRNRIHKYDIYTAGIKSEYNLCSISVPGGDTNIPQGDDKMQWHRLSPQELFNSIVEFLTIEDTREKEIEIVESKKLSECQYSIVDTVKFRKKCMVRLEQQTGPFLGKAFWVEIDDICGNTHCINFNHNAKEIAHWKDINTSNVAERDRTYILHLQSEEPIRLLATLSLAPQYSLKDSPDVSPPQVAPLLFICGPSGVGKSTLINMLMNGFKEKFAYVKRQTSSKSSSERHVKDFQYTSKESMEESIRKGMFLEYNEIDGEYYGTYKQDVEDVVGKMCIFRTDTNSVKEIKANSDVKKVFIFIAPKSLEALDRRLRDRGIDDEESIQNKLARGKQEMEMSEEEGYFDHVVVNDDLSSSYMSLLSIVSGLWPKNTLSSKCNGTVGLFSFESQEKVKANLTKLSSKIEQSVVMDFLRGEHVLQLSVDKNFAYNFNFVSMTPFELKDDYLILKEKKEFNVFDISGNYIEQEPRAWSIWFRRKVEVKRPTLVTLRLHAADHRMKSYIHLEVINNDDASSESIFVTTETAPILFQPNSRGYSILGYSRNNGLEALPESSWKFISYSNDKDFELQDSFSDNIEVLSDSYAANINFLVCRYVLKLSEWTQIAFLAEVLGEGESVEDVKAGMTVSIIKKKKSSDEKEEAMPQQYIDYDIIKSWDVMSLLTVPAFNFEDIGDDGTYMIQVMLNPEKCSFDLQANGESSVPLQWKLHISSTSKSFSIVKDDSREVYFQSVMSTWNNADGGDTSKRAAAALKSLDAYEEELRSDEPKDEIHRTGKDGVEVLLSPSKHMRTLKSTKSMEERILNESTLLNREEESQGEALSDGKEEDKNDLSAKRKSEKQDALKAIMELRQKSMQAMNEFVKKDSENEPEK